MPVEDINTWITSSYRYIDISILLNYYYEINSHLLEENRHIAHNYYLSFAVAFGMFPGLLFLIYLLFHLFKNVIKNKNWIAIFGLSIIACSFLTGDTLETQMGVTLSAFIFSYSIIKPVKDKNEL